MKIIFFDIWWTLMDTTEDLFSKVSVNKEIQKNFKELFQYEKSLLHNDNFKSVKELLNTCWKKLKIEKNCELNQFY